MIQQSHGGKPQQSEAERREARAQCILDAASALILRYGSHKVTVEDIAGEAGVGKGTLYLHWHSREALFAALILREKVEYVRHPMYSTALIFLVSTTLLLGSWYGLFLGLLLFVGVALRAVQEERTLRAELAGYDEYMGQVK